MTDRELDALVAENVLGDPMPTKIPEGAMDLELCGSPVSSDGGCWTCSFDYDKGDKGEWLPFPFSRDMSSAWNVMENMRKRLGPDACLNFNLEKGCWHCSFPGHSNEDERRIRGYGDTPMKAICLAALKAVGVDIPA